MNGTSPSSAYTQNKPKGLQKKADTKNVTTAADNKSESLRERPSCRTMIQARTPPSQGVKS